MREDSVEPILRVPVHILPVIVCGGFVSDRSRCRSGVLDRDEIYFLFSDVVHCEVIDLAIVSFPLVPLTFCPDASGPEYHGAIAFAIVRSFDLKSVEASVHLSYEVIWLVIVCRSEHGDITSDQFARDDRFGCLTTFLWLIESVVLFGARHTNFYVDIVQKAWSRLASREGSAEARTRTWDRLVTVTFGGKSADRRNSEALYQLSYFGSTPDTRLVLIGLSFPPDSSAIGYRTPILPARRRPIDSRSVPLAP